MARALTDAKNASASTRGVLLSALRCGSGAPLILLELDADLTAIAVGIDDLENTRGHGQPVHAILSWPLRARLRQRH